MTDLGDEYQEVARKTHIDFSVECGAPVEVACSPGILADMMENLIRNAFKYMSDSEKRQVIARAQVRGSFVHVEVEDTGPGVPEEIKDHLFEPFVRGRSKSGEEGIGIGLATVKSLVEAYGGRIGVQSKRGEGSTFWFDLPMALP